MSNVTTINGRLWLTKEEVCRNICDDLKQSDKIAMVGIKGDGELVMYSTDAMTPAEQVAAATYMLRATTNALEDSGNVSRFHEEFFE